MFVKLVNMSIATSWLILAVIVLRAVLKKAPKWIRCALWALVAVRLLCPATPESALSLVPSAETIPPELLQMGPAENRQPAVLDVEVNPAIPGQYTPQTGRTVERLQIREMFAALAWPVGVAAMLGYAAVSRWLLGRKVRAAIPLRGRAYICDEVKTPFILGIVRPRIYLPSDMEEERMRAVMAHEEAHIARRDHWWKPLGFALLSVYWFNPMIWLAYVLLCRDIELACDERVIKRMALEEKKAYSEALLACSLPHRALAACPLAFGEVGVKERIRNVLRYKKPALWVSLAAVAVCCAAAVCFLTDPVQKDDEAGAEVFGRSYYAAEALLEPAPGPEAVPEIFLTAQNELGWQGTHPLLYGGKVTETELTSKNFDDYMKDGKYGKTLRRECRAAWYYDVKDTYGTDANGEFGYLLLQKNGDVYLALGLGQGKERAIRWLFRLERRGRVQLSLNSTGMEGSAETRWLPPMEDCSPESLAAAVARQSMTPMAADEDWTERLAPAYVKRKSRLLIEVEGGCDEVTVYEDRYDAGQAAPQRTVHTVKKDAAGVLLLTLPYPDVQQTVQTVYSVPYQDGVYLMRVKYGGSEGRAELERQEARLAAAVSEAIRERNGDTLPDGLLHAESYVELGSTHDHATAEDGTSRASAATAYVMVMRCEYRAGADGEEPETVREECLPAALTFAVDENGEYTPEEYWQPGEGRYYEPEIRGKFPAEQAERALRAGEEYTDLLRAECMGQARLRLKKLSGTQEAMNLLLDEICASPAYSSAPGDYVKAHPEEYEQLLGYGDGALRYIFAQFVAGGQIGLRGHIMRIAMDDLIGGEALKLEAATGQEYFDAWLKQAHEVLEREGEEYLRTNAPKAYMALEMEKNARR